MKLAFSTLGCPAWTLDQVIRAAKEYGYNGVEVRGLMEHVDLRQSPVFQPNERSRTRARFADAGLDICCLGASASFADSSKVVASLDEGRAYVEIAAELGCPLVRVFGGSPGPGDGDGTQRVSESLRELAPFAESHGVAIVLETHDAFSTGARVAEALNQVNHPAVGSLWDPHHPYRQGEQPADTYAALAPSLYHVHVKDSRAGDYCLLGEGDVPIREMLELIMSKDDGRQTTDNRRLGVVGGPSSVVDRPAYVSLEWEKRWHPEIAEPEVAFPQYAAMLRWYLRAAA